MFRFLRSSAPAGGARSAGLLFALGGAVLMSLDPIFIRLSGVGGFDTAFLFGIFTTLSMAAIVHAREPDGVAGVLRAGGLPVVVSGLLMLGSAATLVMSVKLTTVANTFVILSGAPAVSALFGWYFLGEVTARSTWWSIAVAMVGVAIVVSGSVELGHWLGDFYAVLAVVFLSLNQTLMRRYQGVSRMASVGLGGMFLALTMAFFVEPMSYSARTWLIMGAMGLVTAPFGRVMAMQATRYISAPEVGVILMVEAVFAPLWAYGFFAETPAVTSVLGGACILGAALYYTCTSLSRG